MSLPARAATTSTPDCPSAAFSVYGNWGRTFQIVTGSRSPAYLTTGTAEIKPSINTGIELGTKFRLTERTEARIALWQQDATAEVANLPSANATQNLGETRRKGVDFQINAHITDKIKLWFSHAYQEAKIVGGYTSGGISLVGKEVFSTPRHITNVGMDYQITESLRFDLQGRAQSSYYIDDQNSKGKYGGYILFNGGMHYALTKNLEIDLQIKNMFNRKYEYVWYDNFFYPASSYQPMFSPGAGRSFYASLNVKI